MSSKERVTVLTAGGAGRAASAGKKTNKTSRPSTVSPPAKSEIHPVTDVEEEEVKTLEYEVSDQYNDNDDNDDLEHQQRQSRNVGDITQFVLPYSDDIHSKPHASPTKEGGRPLSAPPPPPTPSSSTSMYKKPTHDMIWLLVCFLGIMASFVCYGLLLEYTTSGGRQLHELSFLFVTSGLYTLTAAAGRYVRDETPTTIPPARFAVLGLTSMGSTFCSVRSLRYVYILCCNAMQCHAMRCTRLSYLFFLVL